MEESNFDRLLYRYLHNQLSEKEKLKFEAWLNVLEKEDDGNLELSDADEERLFQRITSEKNTVQDVVALYPEQPGRRRPHSRQWLQVAAGISVLMIFSFLTWKLISDDTSVHYIASTGTKKTILSDGTIVWIKPGSEFTFDEKGTQRHASLKGEALFEVARMPDRPFAITCGTITATVLGTSFNLKATDNQVELDVLTGKVKLTSRQDSSGIDVLPNEKVVYNDRGAIQRLPLKKEERTALISKTDYDMLFDNTPMETVLERVAGKFDVRIHVSEKRLHQCRVTADLTDTSLENTLTILSDLLNMTYRIENSTVKISGAGCD